jgi:hypothetical protein
MFTVIVCRLYPKLIDLMGVALSALKSSGVGWRGCFRRVRSIRYQMQIKEHFALALVR